MSAMRDKAAANGVAMHTIKIDALDIGCYAHTIDHVGGNFDVPYLEELWFSFIAHVHEWSGEIILVELCHHM